MMADLPRGGSTAATQTAGVPADRAFGAIAPSSLVRIVGLMRSGTNLLTWALRNNFSGVQTATMLLGWKHGPILRGRSALVPDDLVDPRYRGEIRSFIAERPEDWSRVTGSDLYRAAAAAVREQCFGVALAVRDPAHWYASCVRIGQQMPGFLPFATSPRAAAAAWNDAHEGWLGDLGERSVIVDTDALRRAPEAWLDRMAGRLGFARLPATRLPDGYLHPQGTEEFYELLGEPVATGMEREFTSRDAVDPAACADFVARLDPGLLARLGLAG